MDPRVKKLAKVLVHYSVKLKKGQLVRIQGEYAALPLITAVFEEAVDVGAYPYARIVLPELDEIYLKKAAKHQLEYMSPINKYDMDKVDAFISIWASSNTRVLSGVDPQRQATLRKHQKPIFQTFFKRSAAGTLSWVGTLFPTNAEAQEADMSLVDWEDFVYRAGKVDAPDPVKHWQKVAKEQDRLVKILNMTEQLYIRSADTDLKLKVKGRKWINCAGTNNFPDGEIFTSPIENTAEGYIHFTYPAVYMGREVENVRLEFKKGKVVKAKAEKNQAYLTSMLDMDKGARFVGEIAIGTNYSIKKFTKNILFDEKIGGTCHLAVGASIPEAGGKNQSALHWDMVCNMKKDAEILADGKAVYRNGKFVV